MPGKYQSLYQYLDNRYADTVVLTFAQIEDLLGFTLPDSARVHHEWWANNDPNDTPRPHSRSLMGARRLAQIGPVSGAHETICTRAPYPSRRLGVVVDADTCVSPRRVVALRA